MIKEVREAETALPGSFPDPGPRHTPRRRDPLSIPVRACPSPGPLIHSLSFIHLPLQQPRGSLCAQPGPPRGDAERSGRLSSAAGPSTGGRGQWGPRTGVSRGRPTAQGLGGQR